MASWPSYPKPIHLSPTHFTSLRQEMNGFNIVLPCYLNVYPTHTLHSSNKSREIKLYCRYQRIFKNIILYPLFFGCLNQKIKGIIYINQIYIIIRKGALHI